MGGGRRWYACSARPRTASGSAGASSITAQDIGCGVTDHATSWDAGLAYRKRWAGGSLFTAEGGAEMVARPRGVG